LKHSGRADEFEAVDGGPFGSMARIAFTRWAGVRHPAAESEGLQCTATAGPILSSSAISASRLSTAGS